MIAYKENEMKQSAATFELLTLIGECLIMEIRQIKEVFYDKNVSDGFFIEIENGGLIELILRPIPHNNKK